MSARRLLGLRRLRVSGPSDPKRPAVFGFRALPSRAPWILALTAAASLGIHGAAAFWIPSSSRGEGFQETLVSIVNDSADKAPPEKTELPDPAEEQRIHEPEPEPEERLAQAGEDSVRDPDEAAEDRDEPLDEAADPESLPEDPPPEVFGIDLADTIDSGALAVRVGNSLSVRPGKFVDPADVKPLRPRRGRRPPAQAEPTLPETPELPELALEPTAPPPEPPKLAKVDVPELKPPREPLRIVPTKKYREKVRPGYTEEAQEAEVEGVVEIDVWIDRNGLVKKAKIVRGLGYGLDERVMEAALRSTFNPVLVDGDPISCKYRLKYRFRLF